MDVPDATVVDLPGRLRGMSSERRQEFLLGLVREHIFRIAPENRPEDLPADASFRRHGIYRERAAQFRAALSETLGIPLPATLLFDCPDPASLARRLLDRLQGAAPTGTDAPAGAADRRAADSGAVDDDPVVIVGMSCRFPGADDPDALWRLLERGEDSVGEFPTDRGWDTAELFHADPEHPGTSYVRRGAFLDDVAGFDSQLFGISPREAVAMDPQQRILLEVVWETLERAGIDATALRGSSTGVFVGANWQDYLFALEQVPGLGEGYRLTGSAQSVLSGRVSYTFGFEGPAMTVDTACSSSLVALHQARHAIRAGECDRAIVAGTGVLTSPRTFVDFSRKRVHSRDGRCKAYAEAADGTGWGEGIAAILVERLSTARAEGHRVLAVVRGSAVNQDGASNGLAAPNGPAQERVIRQALADAGLDPAAVDAVEGHGTGTALGDPIEVAALQATYGPGRPADRPLWLGSVKSNINHTQGAAGLAGVLKMVLALDRDVLPRTLHVDSPSSTAEWADGGVALLTEPRAWAPSDRGRIAGVSAFGVSGTNAHVLIGEPPAADAPAPAPAPDTVAWPLSAVDPAALRAQAGRLLAHLEGPGAAVDPAAVGRALVRSRTVLKTRAVVVGARREDLLTRLSALAAGEPAAGLVEGRARTGVGRPVFVFPGQGGHWTAMGAELMRSSTVFAAAVDDCAEVMAGLVDWSVADVLAGAPDAPPVDRPDVMGPASFVMMVALARLWRSYGLEPAAVVGHSQGEIAAAHVAGALSLADAARIVVGRSQVMLRLLGNGAMLAVAAPRAEVESRLARFGDRLSVAAVNSPAALTLSGDPGAIEELQAELSAAGLRVRRIPGADGAGHSSQLEPLRADLLAAVGTVTPGPTTVPFVSTVTGQELDPTTLDADYWFSNARRTVRFGDAVDWLLAAGHRSFLEVGAHPLLGAAIGQTAEEAGVSAVVGATLRRDDGGEQRFLEAAAELHVQGVAVDWAGAYGDTADAVLDLPTYPFQHIRYWPDAPEAVPAQAGSAAEARFWTAVEAEDPTALAELIDGAEPLDLSPLKDVLPALAGWHRRDRERSELDHWRYRVVWKRVPDPAPAPAGGRWLVLVPAGAADSELVRALLDGLPGHGPALVPVEVPAEPDRAELARELAGAAADLTGVLSLLALDESPAASAPGVPVGMVSALTAIHALADAGIGAPLWLATTAAVATGDADVLAHPLQAQAWGLGRATALEQPDSWGGLVDLPGTPDAEALRRLAGLLADAGDEDQLAVRDTGVYVRRLVRAPAGPPAREWRPRPDGTVLVTGGTGALAGHVARWLATAGAGHVVLAGRRGAGAPGMAERVADLEALGTRVTVAECDVRDREALRSVLAAIPADLPLSAVVHTAGVGRLQALAETTPADLSEVMAAKADGASLLHELTRDLPLDAFVLFSAVSGIWGVGRQAHYGAANTYLDALARHRRDNGLVATSIAWTGWADAGMAVEDASAETLRRHGLPPGAWDQLGMTKQEAAKETGDRWGLHAVQPERQLAALQQVLDLDETTVAVADVDWATFVAGFASARPRPLLDDIPEARAAARELLGPDPDEVAGPGDRSLREELAGMTRAEQTARLVALVRAHTASVLGQTEVEQLDVEANFLNLGFDSGNAVQLRNRLGAATGHRLQGSAVFDHPSVAELAEYLRTELAGAAAEPETPAAAPAAVDTLVRLYERACVTGAVADGVAMLESAGSLRETYAEVAELPARPEPLQMADGPRLPVLVCFTPYIVPAGPQQYARFAATFRGSHPLWALAHPGFAAGEPVAATPEALFDAHAATVAECVGDRPFVLVGYSSGGWVAHGVAARLEDAGRPATGVVMLDSFSLQVRDDPAISASMMARHLSSLEFVGVSGDELSAMGHYRAMLERWSVPTLTTPSLLVRASDAPSVNGRIRPNSTPPPDHVTETVVVAGDHYSIMQDGAPETAAAVLAWISAAGPRDTRSDA